MTLTTATARDASQNEIERKLLSRYGCETLQFAGSHDGLYEHDVLARRWVQTEDTYTRVNPKRIYYLSMEYLLGRSLAYNVSNLMLEPLARKAIEEEKLDWQQIVDQEPDAGLGNGGLGRLAACFLDSMATLQLPAM